MAENLRIYVQGLLKTDNFRITGMNGQIQFPPTRHHFFYKDSCTRNNSTLNFALRERGYIKDDSMNGHQPALRITTHAHIFLPILIFFQF